MKHFYTIIFILIPVISFSQWSQLGFNIANGNSTMGGVQNGQAVSINAAGTIVAVGAPKHDDAEFNVGQVTIFEFINNTSWQQVGLSIVGNTEDDEIGSAISLNAAGNIVVVGAPLSDDTSGGLPSGEVKIFENVAGNWTQIGNDIDGSASNDEFGHAVSINASGNIIAVGAPFFSSNDRGLVRVYENISGVWTQVGADIVGVASSDAFGFSVDLNAAGNIVAIGASGVDATGSGTNSGEVKIFENIAGTWTQIGSAIAGESANDLSGYSISLNSAGDIVAIGSPDNSSNRGSVRIFQNNAGTWTQLGSDIDGDTIDDRMGRSVSLNATGNILAVGAPLNSDSFSQAGKSKIFQFISGNWTQIDADLNGNDTNVRFGESVALNATGDTIILGAPGTSNGSYAAVYNNSDVLGVSQNEILKKVLVYPNPVNNHFYIQTNLAVKEIQVIDISGKIVKSFYPNMYSKFLVDDLKSGLYLLRLNTDLEQIVKKIVIH
ncbi:MAG: T9SS type A sorting domain-containing protein [bacterium]